MLHIQAKKIGNVAVLGLQGQVVIGETRILREAVLSLPRVSAVVLDLARVATIDARGLGVMLELRTHAEANGIRFALTNVSKQVGALLEMTRLDTVFQITSGLSFLRKPRTGATRRWRRLHRGQRSVRKAAA